MTAHRSEWIPIICAWAGLTLVVAVPLAAASTSTLIEWRGPIYVVAGFAGVVAMALLLVQPLLAMGYMPGLAIRSARRAHRWTGVALVTAVVLHVAGLWITSPPDVIDALLFRSPTPFSAWGVIAMWAVFATALAAGMRKRLQLRPKTWQRVHTGLAVVIVICTLIHAALIEGTMETTSKVLLSALILAVIARTFLDLKSRKRSRGSSS